MADSRCCWLYASASAHQAESCFCRVSLLGCSLRGRISTGTGTPDPPPRLPHASPQPRRPSPGGAHVKKGGKLYCQGHTKLIAAAAAATETAATGTAAAASRPAPLPARARTPPPPAVPGPGHALPVGPRPTSDHALPIAPPPPDGGRPGSGARCRSRCPRRERSLRQEAAGRPVPGGRWRWEVAQAGAVEGSNGQRTSARRGGRSV